MYRGYKSHKLPTSATSPPKKENLTDMIMLLPGTATKGSNVEEFTTHLETHVGANFPGMKKFFKTEASYNL